jgi:APA family basic amino acid/polyamine antiporter
VSTVARLTVGRRKTVDETLATTEAEGFRLRRELSALDVVVLGVGVIIGAGIFVQTGQVAATEAGPAVMLSFVFAGVVCAFAALCYAELAAMVPAAGSAYTFTYATLGELVAFIIGWDLVLEFTVGAAAVATGWSAYLNSTLDQIFGVTLPADISTSPGDGGVVNLPAIAVVAVMVGLLVRGIKLTAKANLAIVAITIAVLLTVIVVGSADVNSGNWTPFVPFGWDGMVNGAALVFFAYIGFDIVATTAEETHKPQRDMPIGILGSLAIVTVLYVAVAAVVTGLRVYSELGSAAPLADAFEAVDKPWAAAFVYGGALVAITNTVLILLLGQSRVAFAMARDRLLPGRLAATHSRYGTPHRITLIVGTGVAVLAGLVSFSTLYKLVNIGTLFAFVLVAIGVLILRRIDPERPRPFRTPLVPWLPLASIGLAIWLASTLDGATWLRFVIWMVLGLIVYGVYSLRTSRVGNARAD